MADVDIDEGERLPLLVRLKEKTNRFTWLHAFYVFLMLVYITAVAAFIEYRMNLVSHLCSHIQQYIWPNLLVAVACSFYFTTASHFNAIDSYHIGKKLS